MVTALDDLKRDVDDTLRVYERLIARTAANILRWVMVDCRPAPMHMSRLAAVKLSGGNFA